MFSHITVTQVTDLLHIHISRFFNLQLIILTEQYCEERNVRKYAIRNRQEQSREDSYLNILACKECSTSLAEAFPNAKEISEIFGDSGYEDRCALCGVSFFDEIHDNLKRRTS